MAGVKGAGGRVPKRQAQRRRRNKPDVPVETAEGASEVKVPPVGEDWHSAAARFYNSLADSGQARYYQPSDWSTAWILAESISRELSPQAMVVGTGDDAHIEMVLKPPRGNSLSSWSRMMAVLMVTEGDRRRLRLELERPATDGEGVAGVSELDEYRRRASGSA